MAKAADLDIDLTAAMHQPPAATAPRSIKENGRETQPPKYGTSVNFRWPAEEVTAWTHAATDADMTMQDYLLTCFHAFSQTGRKQ